MKTWLLCMVALTGAVLVYADSGDASVDAGSGDAGSGEDDKISVNCDDPNNVVIGISSDDLGGVDASSLVLGDGAAGCAFADDGTGTFTVSTQYNTCAPTVTQDDNYVILKWSVNAQPLGSAGSEPIARDSTFQGDATCNFLRNAKVSYSFTGQSTKSEFMGTGTSTFTYAFTLCSDSGCVTPTNAITINTDLYGKVEWEQPLEGFKFFVTDLYARPSDNSTDPYDIITDGCILDETTAEDAAGSSDTSYGFKLTSFRFTNAATTSEAMTAEGILCEASDSSPECSAPIICAPIAKRKRSIGKLKYAIDSYTFELLV